MKLLRNFTKTVLAGISITMMVGSLSAQMYTGTLADLVNGGTLAIDDKVFTGFTYQATGLTSFDPTQITVTASMDNNGIEYLTWSGNISLVSAGVATADLKLNYIVTATVGTIVMIDQAYTGSAQNGFLAIDETAAIGSFGGIIVGSSHLTGLIPSNPPVYSNDVLDIVPPEVALYVTKDIAFGINSANGGFITVSQVAQSFHQIPEPGLVSLTILSGLVLWLRSRKCGGSR